ILARERRDAVSVIIQRTPGSVAPALIMALSLRSESSPAAKEQKLLDEAEAARTDKQVGASSESPAATALNEKEGLPYFLAIALEHGAIEQDKSATAITVSTTPYMVAFMGGRDTQPNFEKYWLWRRIGLSGSFAIDMGGDSTSNDLKTADLSEFALRLQF